MKTHFKKLRNPNYIGAWDLMDDNGTIKNRVLTISETKKETVFDGKGGSEECVVVYFKESKPMVMNATNLRTLSKNLDSPFIEDWVGKQIELTVKKIRAFGEMHDALRVVSGTVKTQTVSIPESITKAATLEELKAAYDASAKTPEIIAAKDKRKAELTK
jgi:hypothetical protein